MFKKWPSLALFLVLCLFIDIIGGFFVNFSLCSWYIDLKKPGFCPPTYVFGPVWTCLYVMIAASGWLVWEQPHSKERTRAFIFYAGQLLFNLLWSFCFFFLKKPIFGLVDIVVLFVFILLTMRAFFPLSRPAFALLIPYVLWTVFAFILNLAFIILN